MKKSRLLPVFLVVFVDLLGFGLILPLLPYYADSYGATPFLVGLLTALVWAAAPPVQASVPTGFTPTFTPQPPPPQEPPLLAEAGEGDGPAAWAGFAAALLGAGLVGLGLWRAQSKVIDST